MRLITWQGTGRGGAALLLPEGRHLTLRAVNAALGRSWPETVEDLIGEGLVGALARWWREGAGREALPLAEPTDPAGWGPLFRPWGKVWGIGLNYREHAEDLGAAHPEEPASFMKPADTVAAPGAGVALPKESARVTAEAELGLVLGREARGVSEAAALEAVAGAVAVLDFTAEDILQKNPRYLTRAKSFDGFFSFGPVLVTLDEWPRLGSVRVATAVNGEVRRENTVDRMRFAPAALVAAHARVFTWRPGDLLLTGTPGAAVVRPGDVAEAQVGDLPPLRQPIRG